MANGTIYKFYDDVHAFHVKFRSGIGTRPNLDNGEFRAKFLIEEAGETAKALKTDDAAETIDGLCDLLYVTIGAAIEFGIAGFSALDWHHTDAPNPGMSLFDRRDEWAALLVDAAAEAAKVIRWEMTIDLEGHERVAAQLVSLVKIVNCAILAWGVDIRPFWDEVQRSNMDKVPSGAVNVKTIKPPGWKKPQMIPILMEQYGLSGPRKVIA